VLVTPTLVLALLAGDLSTWTPEPRWLALAAVVLLTTPLQAAGEEYLFRGWLPQAVGAMIPGAVLSALLSGGVASTVFALAHGQQDRWLFGTRFAFGAISCWLVWRTGGLEASIALHGVNNMAAFALAIGQGALAEGLTATSADVLPVAVQVGTLSVAAAIMVAMARRGNVARLFVPPLPGRPTPGAR